MRVSQKQVAPFIRTIVSIRRCLVHRRMNSTQISSLLHDSLGVKLPSRKPIILSGNVGLTFNDRLAALHADIDSGNVSRIWKNFSDLRDAGQVDHLSLSDLEKIDEAIAPTIYRYGAAPQTSKPSTTNTYSHRNFPSIPQSTALGPIEQMRELGLWLAVRGPICVLRACMIRALRDSDSKSVLDLWRAFMSRCLTGEGAHFLEAVSRSEASSATRMPQSKDDPFTSDSLATVPPVPQQNLLTYHPGRPELLQLTICAHAIQDDFRGAFDTVYPTLVPLKPKVARDLLEPVRQIREDVVFKALRYINDLDLLRLLSRPWSFRNHLFHFVQSLDVDNFQTTYQEMLRLLREPDPWVGLLTDSPGPPLISPDPKSKPIFSVSRQTWSDFLEGAGVLKRPGLRESIWKDFLSLGGTPTTGMWNTLLLGYIREGSLGNAEKVWLAMGKDGHDVVTYTTMIRGLFERRLPSKAIAYYEEMKRKIPQVDITIRAYNVVVHGLFINKCAPDALRLVSELETGSSLPNPTHPAPDITTYNTVLRYHARRREMSPLSKVLHTIADKQLRPDIYTLTTILNALLAVGVQEAPSKILEIMKALRVQVNQVVASELIEHVIYHVPGRAVKKTDRFQAQAPADSTHQEVELSPRERLQTGVKMLVAFENAGVETNVVNYTSLMAAFHRAAGAGTGPKSISHAEAQQATQALRARMQKRKIHENRVTYNILIGACLEGGSVPKSEWRKLSPPPTTVGARPAIDPSSVPPNVEQAVRYFHEMRGASILPNHDTWYILLQGVASHGQIPLAQALCDEIVKTGFIPQTGLLRLIMQIRGGY